MDSTSLLWIWYGIMTTVATFNMVWLYHRWCDVSAKDTYGLVMKIFGIPWVFECAWRSVFPSLYLQRFVFWDTILNSIIVDRTLACVGELCWASQFAFAMDQLDVQLNGEKKSTWWIRALAILAVAVYVAAECTSYYNVATTNEFWCAVEVILDGISFLIMTPGYVSLLLRIPGPLRGAANSPAKIFVLVTTIVCVVYPLYNFCIDAPMYMKRYHEDQRNHKQYFSFMDGLKDAAVRRVPTHELGDWEEDMSWMTMYFSFGAWSGLYLMRAPRVTLSTDSSKVSSVEQKKALLLRAMGRSDEEWGTSEKA
eukprot:g3118.t1